MTQREITVNISNPYGVDFITDPKERQAIQDRLKETKQFQGGIRFLLCTAWVRNRLGEGDRLTLQYDGVNVGTAVLVAKPGTESFLHMTVASGASLEVDVAISIARKLEGH